MRLERLKRAQAEARRFIQRCEDLREALEPTTDYLYGGKETAAVRRASMDLTRVLADLRKPN